MSELLRPTGPVTRDPHKRFKAAKLFFEATGRQSARVDLEASAKAVLKLYILHVLNRADGIEDITPAASVAAFTEMNLAARDGKSLWDVIEFLLTGEIFSTIGYLRKLVLVPLSEEPEDHNGI